MFSCLRLVNAIDSLTVKSTFIYEVFDIKKIKGRLHSNPGAEKPGR